MQVVIANEDKLITKKLEEELILFKDLFHDFYPQLLSFAFKYVHNKYASEDIVQDVFLSIWNRKEFINFDEPMKPLLYKVTYNKTINYLNSNEVKCRIDNNESIDEQLNREITNYNQHDMLMLKETTHEINRIIEMLSPQCKKVFLLSRKNNLKNKEIAELLNISEKTVEKHITKALTEIRTHLIDMGLMSTFIGIIGWSQLQ